MCGIAGMIDTTGRRPLDRELLLRMSGAIRHRGPDESGTHIAPGVALAHRRLAIIDLSSGQQPMYNEDRSVVVIFNGEIYNFPEIAAELAFAGHRFRTHSDTEVLVHAWEEWGRDSVLRLNGMFAYALWDENRGELFLARDRLGKKPLYYAQLPDGTFCFASELKALLVNPGVSRALDYRALEEYLALGYVPDPKSIFAGVRKLSAAHTLVVKRGERLEEPREYWDLAFRNDDARSAPELGDELIGRLREATRIRLMSEVPLGAFLSGGVDSSAVVAMMAGLSTQPVNTCSIAFTDPRFDESAYATEVAERYQVNHFRETVDLDDFELLDKLVEVYDEPFADSSAIPTYRVCQLARKRVTVALSGDGGDEVFAGYRRYRWHMNEERIRSLMPLPARRALFGTLGAIYPKMDWAPRPLRAKATLQGLARDSVEGYFHSVSVTTNAQRRALYSDQFRRELSGYNALEVFRHHAGRGATSDPLSLAQYIDFKTYLPGDILVKVDRASMAHSLEVRCPILDYTFVEWASKLSPSVKLAGQEGKHLFKRCLEPYVPRETLYREKMGFAVPIAGWFRGPLRSRVRQALLNGSLRATGLFRQDTIERMVNQHQSGARDHSAPLWSLLMFEGFLRQIVRA
jgi:asparagine synthase (glutamine-hydrolysing)